MAEEDIIDNKESVIEDSAAPASTEKSLSESDPAPQEKPKKSLKEDLKDAFKASKEKNLAEKPIKDAVETPKATKERDITGKFQPKESKIAKEEPKLAAKDTLVPNPNFPAAIKSKWDKIDPEVKSALLKREADFEKLSTTMDEERNFAKEMQKTILPYMALLNSENTTPVKAVQNLLNTAHILRNSSAQQKGALLWQLAQQYGADMRVTPQAAQQPSFQIGTLQQELQKTKEELAKLPELIKQ